MIQMSNMSKIAQYGLILVAGVTVLGLIWLLFTPKTFIIEPTSLIPPEEPTTTEIAPVLPAAEPIAIDIPAVGIVADFEQPLGVNEDRTIEVPDGFDTVGWYRYGPTPGELGPAVVLGHVDSFEGPAIFFSLGQLSPGDDIFINREDGSRAHFVVTRLERVEQDTFPTAQVYSDIDHAGLRLITCSGTFIHGEQRYTHNLIVFAELVPPAAEET